MEAQYCELFKLLELLYEGLAFPERWGDFLEKVYRKLGGDSASLLFNHPGAGAPGPEAVELVEFLLPHLRRASQIYQKMEKLRACAESTNAALEQLETAVIALSGNGSVVSMNRRAEALIERNGGLTLRQGKLTATDPRQAAQLEQLIRAAALTGAGLGISSGGAMLLHRMPLAQRQSPSPSSENRGISQPLTLRVTPFHSSHVLTEDRPCALVFISDPEERPASRAALLSALYALTPAESRLADLILEELELRRAAERMRITVNTARFMLKSIFQKTETHRQSQLVRLLMSIPGEAQR